MAQFIESEVQRQIRILRCTVFILSILTTTWIGFTVAVITMGGC